MITRGRSGRLIGLPIESGPREKCDRRCRPALFLHLPVLGHRIPPHSELAVRIGGLSRSASIPHRGVACPISVGNDPPAIDVPGFRSDGAIAADLAFRCRTPAALYVCQAAPISPMTLPEAARPLAIVGNAGGTNVGESLRRAACADGRDVCFFDACDAMAGPRAFQSFVWHFADRRPLQLERFSAAVIAR